jgi:hypothetical protein
MQVCSLIRENILFNICMCGTCVQTSFKILEDHKNGCSALEGSKAFLEFEPEKVYCEKKMQQPCRLSAFFYCTVYPPSMTMA